MGLRYTGRFMMMWREPLRISDLYGGFMEALDEVDILVGTYARMISSMMALLEAAWYAVSQ